VDKALEQIHRTSMDILEQTGVKFHQRKVLDLLISKGVKVIGETAYFTQDQVMDWVSKAPASFNIYARNPKYDMNIGGDHIEYVSCNSGFPWIADFEGAKRKAVLNDYIAFLKLVQQTSYFKMNGGVMVTPADLPSQNMYPIMLYYTLLHSDKCLFGGMGGADETQAVMDMLQIVFGNKEALINKPRIVTIISPLSPLQFDEKMLDTLMIYGEYGQPMIIAPAVMAGTTGPVTLAGTIALSNAETLAGIITAQMVRPGTPVLYGSASATADMKSAGFAIGSPESALCAMYCARMAKYYHLPCRGGGTLNDAKSVSVQAGYEGMMVLLVAAQEKINFILHSAGAIDSYGSMSYEKYIVDLEIIGMVERLVRGINTDPKHFAIDVIHEIGPGGEYLTHDHTMEFCRKEPWLSEISLRGASKDKNPNEALLDNINGKKMNMLENFRMPDIDPELINKLREYLINQGVSKDIFS